MNARTGVATPIVTPNTGFRFFETGYARALISNSGSLVVGLIIMSLVLGGKKQKPAGNAENQDQTDRHQRTKDPCAQVEDAADQAYEDG